MKQQKATLRGGPLHGQTVKFYGGESITIPVKYKHPSYLGIYYCAECKEEHEHYKSIFNRRYRLNYVYRSKEDFDVFADYVGEE